MGYWSAVAGSFGKVFSQPIPYFTSVEYNSNARSGMFGCRLLNDTYTGDCMRIRRDRDNEELDIGFSGRHLDAQAIHDFCFGDTCYVTTWYDQSNNGSSTIGEKAYNTFTSVQPIIFESNAVTRTGTSNAPAIKFVDNDFLEINVDDLNRDTDRSFFSAFTQTSTDVSGNKLFRQNSSSAGNGYFVRLNTGSAEIGVIDDSITFNYVDNDLGDHVVLALTHKGDYFADTDLTLNGSELIIDGDVLQVQSTPTGINVVDGGSLYRIGGDGFDGHINELIYYTVYLNQSAASIEYYERMRGNIYQYYQFQNPLSLPQVVANDATIDAISFPIITESASNPQYQTLTIQGFNVPIQLFFEYDNTNVTLYYRLDEVTTTPTPGVDPYVGMTAIAPQTNISIPYAQNLSLYVDFTTPAAAIPLTIKNATDSNATVNITSLATSEYVVSVNVAEYTESTRTAGTTVTITGFSAVDAGDLLLCFVANDETSGYYPTGQLVYSDTFVDAGFTKLAEVGETLDIPIQLYWKVADGTEDGRNFFIGSAGAVDWMAWLLRIDNVDTSGGNVTPTWLEGFATDSNYGTVETFVGPTVSQEGCAEIIFVGYDGGDSYPLTISGGTQNPFSGSQTAEQSGYWPDTSSGGLITGWEIRQDIETGQTGSVTITAGVADGIATIRVALTPAIS